MAERVAVIGAGIVGIAHAWQEARRGTQVTLFERDRCAHGASVRNFGMIWVVGRPSGKLHNTALRSRQLWREVIDDTGFWCDPCGSLHIACRSDELEVLREFADLAPSLGYDCALLGRDEIQARFPAVRPESALGGLWSPTEMCINPREVIAAAPLWLRDRFGVELQFGTFVRDIDPPKLCANDGRKWHFDRVTVASGVDCEFLFPEVFRRHNLFKCKLQMMRTATQPGNWRLGTLLAGGLTLRHYPNFRVCTSLQALRERVATESPDLDRFGIHVLASQNNHGEVILGDSHQYGDEITPFDTEEINRLILFELQRFLHLPDWTIAERWHGIYSKLPDHTQLVTQPRPGVTVVLSTAGLGMTLSFALAEEFVQQPDSTP